MTRPFAGATGDWAEACVPHSAKQKSVAKIILIEERSQGSGDNYETLMHITDHEIKPGGSP